MTTKRPLEPCRSTRKGCHACENGKCLILSDTNFKGAECPFYKTKEAFIEGIKKYGGEKK